MTLAEVPLPRRCSAVLNVLGANPGLSVAERAEMLAVALWRPEVDTPEGEPRDEVSGTARATPRERQEAVERRWSGVPVAEVAARYCVSPATVKWWMVKAKRGDSSRDHTETTRLRRPAASTTPATMEECGFPHG